MPLKILPLLRRSFILSRWLHCHPYEWDGDANRPRVIKFPSLVQWRCNAWYALLCMTFVLLRTMESFTNPLSSVLTKVHMALLSIFLLCTFPYHLINLNKRFGFVTFIRRYLRFLELFEGISAVPSFRDFGLCFKNGLRFS